MDIEPNPNWERCIDCGIDAWDFVENDIRAHEDFYVNDKLWDQTVPEDDENIICIGCFESRLGRQLTRADFKSTIEPSAAFWGPQPSQRWLARWAQLPDTG